MSSLAREASPVKPKPRKPRPVRTLRLLERPAALFNGYGALRITEGRKVDLYLFRGIEADFITVRDKTQKPPEKDLYLFRGIEADFGEGFEVEKLTPDFATAETYHVNLAGPEKSTCTCKGHTYAGHCRHVEALLKLDAEGQLPRVRMKDVCCPRCGDVSPDGYSGLCPGCEAEDFFAGYDQSCEMEAGGIDPAA